MNLNPTLALIIFVSHWFLSLFAQTFFLHRYCAHGMFRLSPFWEKFFYLFTVITQGSSYLNPRAYAHMHRLHHAHSDTAKDPHSPTYAKNVWDMMLKTYHYYADLCRRDKQEHFVKNCPRWDAVDRVANHWLVLRGWVVVYAVLALILLPWWLAPFVVILHSMMGPVHGAIVNWCGHCYGYVNFKNGDQSRNTLPIDIPLLGELFQNNHHHDPQSLNFAQKPFEIDPGYWVIRGLMAVGIVQPLK